jgi:hypothetical protein
MRGELRLVLPALPLPAPTRPLTPHVGGVWSALMRSSRHRLEGGLRRRCGRRRGRNSGRFGAPSGTQGAGAGERSGVAAVARGAGPGAGSGGLIGAAGEGIARVVVQSGPMATIKPRMGWERQRLGRRRRSRVRRGAGRAAVAVGVAGAEISASRWSGICQTCSPQCSGVPSVANAAGLRWGADRLAGARAWRRGFVSAGADP